MYRLFVGYKYKVCSYKTSFVFLTWFVFGVTSVVGLDWSIAWKTPRSISTNYPHTATGDGLNVFNVCVLGLDFEETVAAKFFVLFAETTRTRCDG